MEATQVSITSEVKYTPKISTRLISLDALRGFDMFWIISGEEIFHGIANVVQEKHSLTRNPETGGLHIMETYLC